MSIEPGLEKTLYKLIKKLTGRKVDLSAAFVANLKSELGGNPEVPIDFICALSESELWLIREDSVQPIDLKYLRPHFECPYKYLGNGQHSYNLPEEFIFEFLPNSKLMKIRPIEASKQVRDFAIWLTMLTEREKLLWWNS